MIKQSNINLDLELSTNLTKTRSQSMEKNHICEQVSARHGFIVTTTNRSHLTNKTKILTSSHTHQIQETNINTTIVDVLENSSSHCSLIESSLKERLDKYLKKDTQTLIISSETKQNLNKLQRITNDVKLLTKQLQLSVQLNKNNNSSSSSTLDEHLLGEICYQLERRILVLIFSKSNNFYGYSLRYLPLIIANEQNKHDRFIYKKRFSQIQNCLSKKNFHFNYHPILTFYFINKFGIYSDYQWLNTSPNILSNINQIKTFCYSLVSNKYHQDLSIILDTLEFISDLDGKPLFYW